ncbi:MAG: PAS domain-containing protein [bacterium]|nr:PAS domain-containing protein [bacterium]
MKNKSSLLSYFPVIPVLLLLLVYPVYGNESLCPGNTLMVSEETEELSLEYCLEYLEDKENNLKLEEVRSAPLAEAFTKSDKKVLNFGLTKSAYWVRFSILYSPVKEKKRREWLLELKYAKIDHVDFYQLNKDGSYKAHMTGDMHPFSTREIEHRNCVFSITTEPGEKRDIYLKVKTNGSLQVPLTVLSRKQFIKNQQYEYFGYGAVYGIMLIMILYNFFLFMEDRNRTYIYYLVYLFWYICTFAVLDGFALQFLWPNSPYWDNKALPIFIFLFVMSILVFGKDTLSTRKNLPRLNSLLNVLFIIAIINCILSLFLELQPSLLISALLIILIPALLLFAVFLSLGKGYRPARIYAVGWTMLLFSVMGYSFRNLGFLPNILLINIGPEIAALIQAAIFSFAVASRLNVVKQEKSREVEELNRILQSNLQELNSANKQITMSEEKYRLLVEGSNEIIFTLDENLKILTVNKAIHPQLKIMPEQVIGMSVFELVYSRTGQEQETRRFIQEKVDDFIKKREPASFKTELRSFLRGEPQEMFISLQFIAIGGKNEILGKAFSVTEDALLKYFVYEKQGYTIGNYLLSSDELAHRLTRNSYKYLSSDDIIPLRIALREILMNAIEHGNLNITFNEKTEALKKNSYLALVAHRREDPRYRNRKVHIEFTIDAQKAMFVISDEGKGFDAKKFLNKEPEEENRKLLPHGRGLFMAKEIFDEISYNEKGNKVVLVKYFNPDFINESYYSI